MSSIVAALFVWARIDAAISLYATVELIIFVCLIFHGLVCNTIFVVKRFLNVCNDQFLLSKFLWYRNLLYFRLKKIS